MDKLIRTIFRNPFLNVLLLAGIQAWGWLATHCVTQFLVYRGRNVAGEDYGISTLLPAWLWACLWGWLVSLRLSKRVLGVASMGTALVSGFLSVPVAFWIIEWGFSVFHFFILGLNLTEVDIEKSLTVIFKRIAFGVLPEGRYGWAYIHALIFLVILATAFMGLLIAVVRHRSKE